ncbi:MAG: anthranilate synthase component II [Vulcanisaeta sp. AZ3]
MSTVVIIDNYDSFVYNIAQYVGELGTRPLVFRNDEVTIKVIERLRPDGIIISPGPGNPTNPRDVGISPDAVKYFAGRVPILGICLGHQIIGVVYGARIRRARMVKHGKTSTISVIRDSRVLRGLPRSFEGMRYHSLVIDNISNPLIVTAISTDDNEVMAVEHARYPVFGLQFHPESIGTRYGREIIKNFISILT